MRLASALVLAFMPAAVVAQAIDSASYSEPTTRYAHAVLGDAVEWGALSLTLSDGRRLTLRLPETLVFEDTAPRLVDLDGDGDAEVITVEASLTKGARLAVYDKTGRIAQTPHIGTRNRWLAPIGAADLDGDGHIEIAYVDRPHLAKVMRIWRYENGVLTEVAHATGHTNHKIGWDFIAGGIRSCGALPEMITASQDWTHILSTTVSDGALRSTKIGRYTGPDSLDQALLCP